MAVASPVLDKATGKFINYVHDAEDPTSLSDGRASAILQDGNGAMWIGTFGNGLNLLDEASGTFRRYTSDPKDSTSLADNMIHALHLDGAGNVWVATAGGGLDRIAGPTSVRNDYHFINVSMSDGLPSNVIYGVQSDANGRIWLSTSFGLSSLNPDTWEVKNLHRGHGLQGEEFNYSAHHRAANGKLYFGGANGYNAFYPNEVQVSDYAPTIVMTAFRKMNQPAPYHSTPGGVESIELGYTDDVVDFTFAALDFTEPTQNRYSHRLEGFDAQWVDTGESRQVTYTNLDAGDYVLRVKAITSDGVESSAEFAVPISVAAAPWATPIAYLIYAFISSHCAVARLARTAAQDSARGRVQP